jgi:N-acetylmuramoyl-L-alanine amidase
MARLATLLALATLTAWTAASAEPKPPAPATAGSARAKAPVQARATIERVGWETVDGRGRLVVAVRGALDYSTHVAGADATAGLPSRVYVDLRPAVLGKDVARSPQAVSDALAQRIRVGQFDPQTVRVVVDLSAPALFEVSTSERPPRLLLALRPSGDGERVAVKQRLPGGEAAETAAPPALAQQPAAAPSPRGAAGKAEATAVAAASPVATATPQMVAIETSAPAPTAAPPRPTPAAVEPEAPKASPLAVAEAPPSVASTPGRARAPAPTPAARPADAAGGRAGTEPPGVAVVPPSAAPRRAESKASRPRPQPSPPVWTVVVDPGHGGRDPGARGVTGEQEKNITLAVSQLVAEILAADPQVRVVLTRTDDSYVSLEQRTAIANAQGADLFVSVHANASENPQLAGIETYTLNNTDDRATIRLAALENGLALTGASPGERDLAYILSDLVQTGKEDESVAAARAVQGNLVSYLRERWKGVTNLGVKKGPFYVLVGAYMPCILVEMAFLTNETEGQRIAARRYQLDVAEGIARGIRRFLASETANANL